MKPYHKINTIYKRDMEGTKKLIEGAFSCPEFAYLQDNEWLFTEKVDGTNIRVGWDGERREFGGRTDNAQIPTSIISRLEEHFTPEKLGFVFPKEDTPIDVTLYGEGYGAKIQKGGGNYIADGVDFVLFDVLIGTWWLERDAVEDIAMKLGLDVVPALEMGTFKEAVAMVRDGMKSKWGDFNAEGLVLRPLVELKNRAGERIITKIKTRDFRDA